MGSFLARLIWRKSKARLPSSLLVYRIMAGRSLLCALYTPPEAVPAVVGLRFGLQVTETQAPSQAVRGVEVLGLGQASCHGSWNVSLHGPS